MGIKNILKFGNNISCISDEDVASIKLLEEKSKIDPIAPQIQIGQEARITSGSLKGALAKICSLPSKERVSVLVNFLGSVRRVNIPEKDIESK